MQDEGADTKTPYVYNNIGQEEDIRLLILQPGKAGDLIRCALVPATFGSHPDYEALSYAWGNNDKTHMIYLLGSLPIGSNLHSALQHLRLEDKPRTLWVDAVCINQQSVTERNQQVPLMGKVYSAAKKVLVWLGKEIATDQEAFRVIGEFENGKERLQDRDKTMEDEEKLKKRILDDPGWRALAPFFQRPWFKRVWVIQEVALAAVAEVHCGSHSCSWGAIARLNAYFNDNGAAALLGGNQFHWVGNIDIVRRAQIGDLREDEIPLLRSLDGLLWQTKIFDATVSHDKIYGLLGLASQADMETVKVDYNMPCSELFKQVAVHRILRGQLFETLSEAGSSPIRDPNMPSWAPDWSTYFNFPISFVSADPRGLSLLVTLLKIIYRCSGKS